MPLSQALQQKLQLPASTQHYLACIEQGNELQLIQLRESFMQYNAPLYPALLSLSRSERIPAMVHAAGRPAVSTTIALLLARFCNSLNISRNMSADQIVVAAEKLLSMSLADHVSLQEIDVFLQSALAGKYGTNYNRMDEAVLLEMFDQYLEQRWQALQQHRENERQATTQIMPDRSTPADGGKLLSAEALQIMGNLKQQP